MENINQKEIEKIMHAINKIDSQIKACNDNINQVNNLSPSSHPFIKLIWDR